MVGSITRRRASVRSLLLTPKGVKSAAGCRRSRGGTEKKGPSAEALIEENWGCY